MADLASRLRGARGARIKQNMVEAALIVRGGLSLRKACRACNVPLGSNTYVGKLAQRIAALAPLDLPPPTPPKPPPETAAPPKVLDLFAGSGSITKAALDAGCEVKSLDNCSEGVVSAHGITFEVDLLEWDYRTALSTWLPDVLWASPPCTPYSDANCSVSGSRRMAQLKHGDSLVARTIEIICFLQTLRAELGLPPLLYVLENPDGQKTMALKNRSVAQQWGSPSIVAHYCQYGLSWRKPTRFWVSPAQAANLVCHICPGGGHCRAMIFSRRTGKWCHKASPGCGLAMYGKQSQLKDKYIVPSELVRLLCCL